MGGKLPPALSRRGAGRKVGPGLGTGVPDLLPRGQGTRRWVGGGQGRLCTSGGCKFSRVE